MTSSLGESLGSDGPGCAPVFRLTRPRKTGEKVETAVRVGSTSLPRARAGAQRLLGLARGHWGIEKGRHGVRAGTRREDARRIRNGSGPQVRAILRNIASVVFERMGHKSATRHYVGQPRESREVLSIPI